MVEVLPEFRSEKRFALSLSQRNIWDQERALSGTSVNNISTTIRINGRVDFGLLQRALDRVLEADASLRTRITLQEGEPLQYQAPYSRELFPIYDFSHTSCEGIESWEKAMTRELIPLLDAPLYRFIFFRAGENAGGVLIKIHHIISDGWSQVMICNRISKTYLALLAGQDVALEAAPSYELHVREEQEYLCSKAYGRDEAYWRETLAKAGEPSVIKSVKSAAVSPVGRRVSFVLPQVLNHAIYSFCVEHRVAPFAVFYMALAIYFKRNGGARRFTIGVPIFNRTNFTFKKSTGMFVSTLPFFNELCDKWSLTEFNEHLAEAWYELLRHQRFPFSHIAALAGGDNEGRLFNIALSYQDSKIYESEDARVVFSGRWHYSGYQAEQLCIHLSNMENHRRYAVDYDYLTQFFSEQEIRALHDSLVTILLEALGQPDLPIYKLSVLRPEERERVVYTFNRTAKPLPDCSLYEVFARVVQEYPQRAAVIRQGRRTTYQALDERARAIGSALRSVMGERKGLIALLLPREEDLLAAMVGVLSAGQAYLVLSGELPAKRLEGILAQSGAAALITRGQMLSGRQLPEGLTVLNLDEPLAAPASPPLQAALDELAYVVYTSGSTGTPKGVEITGRNLLNFVRAMGPVYAKGAVLSVCNVGFDAFMIESIVALLNGRTVVLPEDAQQESPRRLAELIRGYAVGFLSITPSRLSAFLKEPAFAQAMRGIERIVCGGEAFSGELMRRLEDCTAARVYNQYGPSETTIGVSLKQMNGACAITAGAPMDNCKLYVLDEWRNPLPVGVYGELYIGGACVGRGYRNAPELTTASFIPSPFEQGERLYKTGDMACWTAEGEILLAGRLDKQVKLRGLRIEPQEVSACLERHPAVKQAAARVFIQQGHPMLVAYYVAQGATTELELMTFAADYLPRYMLPASIVKLEALPLTASGKVDEANLPAPQQTDGEDDLPAGREESEILAIFREALEKPELGVDSDYFLSGGDSLGAMAVLAKIEERLGQALRISQLYAARTPRKLGGLLRGEDAPNLTPRQAVLQSAPHQAFYPLTPIQQGIYVQSQMDPTGFAYHMAGAFRLPAEPDAGRLQAAFRALIAGDKIFRTGYEVRGGQVVAIVADSVEFTLPVLQEADFEAACKAFLQPFDLARPPLLRAALWQEEADWYLLIDSHHLIGDGMSTPILLERLEGYLAQTQEDVPLGYQDYAYALQKGVLRPGQAQHLAYWREKLNPMPEKLELPTDAARPRSFDFRGGQQKLKLDARFSKAVDEFCEREGITPFALMLAAYGLLLRAVSGREDFTVGTPVSGRLRPELQGICGPFINTLPLRLMPGGELSGKAYLQAVKDTVTELLEHQDCAPEQIISALNLPRSVGQNPLYQVAFSMRPFEVSALKLMGQAVKYRAIPNATAKGELNIEVARESGCYELTVEYASSYFAPETTAFYARCMRQGVRALMEGAGSCLKALDILPPEDRIRLIERPNHTFTPFVDMPIAQLIAQQVLLDPEGVAVYFHGEATTYAQLDAQACRMANLLTRAGVKKGERVGLATRRGPHLYAAMLAILKAGCAYVPFLSSFPEARIAYMLDTAGANHILCDGETAAALPAGLRQKAILLEGEAPDTFEDAVVDRDELIHVLFTSGSTGKPKGVMIPQRAITNLYGGVSALFSGSPGPILCTTQLIFDIFASESLIPLAMGKPIVLADEQEMMLPWKMAELMERHGVKYMQFTASRLQMCLGNEAFCRAAAGLELMIVGGEPVSSQLVERFKAASPAHLINMYGPTEDTVYATLTEVEPGRPVTIGHPMPNTRVYVCDEAGRPVLPTACGELCLAGAGVADGYIGRPDLTEQLFVEDPYFPGEKMYRSGDLGRLRLDGTFDCLGRRDAQVKINGQRVELEEIAAVLLEGDLAREAAAIVLEKPDGSSEIGLFFVPKGETGRAQAEALLQKALPGYMLPSQYYVIAQMPYTATGKTDRRALKAMACGTTPMQEVSAPKASATAQGTEQVAENESMQLLQPAPELGERAADGAVGQAEKAIKAQREEEPERARSASVDEILMIWQEALGTEALRADIPFFEQGGTSLAALGVLSQYYNRHWEMTLEQFYAQPTAAAQAALLTGGESEQAYEQHIPEPRAKRYPRNVPLPTPMQTQPPRSVLLTGATGFFGAHLLRALLDAGTQRVYCLVRGGDDGRLQKTLAWYFGQGWVRMHQTFIKVLPGDVGQHQLGLSAADYALLAGRIEAVYHAAADVRHYVAQDVQTNLQGVQEAIAFAQAAKVPLMHVSTASVAGEYLLDEPDRRLEFCEEDFDIGQNWQDNAYVRSKFLAEAAVYEAMDRGLRAQVYRLGRLVGRATDGVFQRNPENNAFYMLLRAVQALGAMPSAMAGIPMDITPVDRAAEAAVALRDAPMTALHILSPHPPTMGEVVRAVLPQVQLVDEQAFEAMLEKGAQGAQAKVLSPLIETWTHAKMRPARIAPVCVKTARWLARLGAPLPEGRAGTLLAEFRDGGEGRDL